MIAENDNLGSQYIACRKQGNFFNLRFFPPGYNDPLTLPVTTSGEREETGCWSWNGDLENPTLRPSVRTTHPDGRVSHFWLTYGKCLFLGDSTDGNQGNTLSLKKLPFPPCLTMRAHQYLYYVKGLPVLSDYDYDEFCKSNNLDGKGGSDREQDYSEAERNYALSELRGES